MYYLSFIVAIIVFLFWRKDVRDSRKAFKYIIGELRKERRDLDELKEKYSTLLNRPS